MSYWTEYLLYNARKGFLWLVESDEGWDKVRVLDTWPETSGDSVVLDGTRYKKLYDYGSEVIHAAGAFNWRAKVGDHTDLTDFEAGERTLSRETTLDEQTWSLAERVEPADIARWFKKESVGGPSPAFAAATSFGSATYLHFFDDKPAFFGCHLVGWMDPHNPNEHQQSYL